ncbi:MAG: hypothetical protein J6V82_05125 [Clostridia bacterium]|nr:hypothetical protein [Clostridia bacterium]MBO7151117.1 hypothetical protein [Clostridia bacterium]
MMRSRYLRYLNYVLWALPVLFLLAIGAINALPSMESIDKAWDLFLSYGFLFSLCAAMALQTFRHRKSGSSETAFYLKVMALGFLFLTMLVSLFREIFA